MALYQTKGLYMKKRVKRGLSLLGVGLIIGVFFVKWSFNQGESRVEEQVQLKQDQAIQYIDNLSEEKDSVDSESVRNIFVEFINGTRKAYVGVDDEEGFDITSITVPTGETEHHYWSRYTFFDSSGDGIEEMHIQTSRDYIILTYEKGKLYLWGVCECGSELLNDGAFLYTHINGTSKEETYKYYVLDSQGKEEMSQILWRYDVNGDGIFDKEDEYAFNGDSVTKENWDKLAEKYLKMGMNEIEWISIYDETI